MEYNIMTNIGNSRYVVNYHDGIKTHPDGSKFFDIAIFKYKNRMIAFVKDLISKGYKEV